MYYEPVRRHKMFMSMNRGLYEQQNFFKKYV